MAPTLVLSSTMRTCLRLAGLSGASAICLGAYGAHVMKGDIPDERKRVCSTNVRSSMLARHCLQLFQLAQTYHLLHSVAILGAPLVSRPVITSGLFLGGLTLFCGPLYLRAIRNDERFGRVAPYGGTLLIAGWLSILVL